MQIVDSDGLFDFESIKFLRVVFYLQISTSKCKRQFKDIAPF